MPWKYEQNTGRLLNPNNVFVAKGYAGGNCGKHPEGINNHLMQHVHNIGPIPVGRYTIGTPIEESHLGPYAIPLIPDPANEMFGRGNFFMHGEVIGHPGAASDGCIIQASAIRRAVAASDDKILDVVYTG